MAIFKDLDLDFKIHPITGDLTKKTDAEAIKRSIKLLVMTRFGERLFQPEIGSSVKDLLFEQIHPMTTVTIKDTITEVITNFEPRVNLLQVGVDAEIEENAYVISIKFLILGGGQPVNLEFILERTR